MKWENYDLEGVEKALEDGCMISTGITNPTGLTAVIVGPERKGREGEGSSLVGREGVTPESEGPANILKALEIAGKDYQGEELPADEVESTDAISDLLLKQQISHLDIQYDDGYEITDGAELRVEGETFQDAYEELQNEIYSKIDI